MASDSDLPTRGAIAAMTSDRVIGLNGRIPWHYSSDLRRFKRVTMDSTIVMGRLTWESIGSKPLPGRRNIVISRNPVADVECYNSVRQALDACKVDTWIIGGGQIYIETLHWINTLDITYVPDVINDKKAVRFPVINADIWREQSSCRLPESDLLNVVYCRR